MELSVEESGGTGRGGGEGEDRHKAGTSAMRGSDGVETELEKTASVRRRAPFV